MQGTKLGLLAAVALVAGLGGCSLPEVLPLAGGTTAGPSPYGPWYEQHWATNAVLLAAADQPEAPMGWSDDAEVDAALTQAVDAVAAEEAEMEGSAVEVDASSNTAVVEFSDSSPYQFPASSFAPAPSAAPADDFSSPAPAAPATRPAPASGAPIRY